MKHPVPALIVGLVLAGSLNAQALMFDFGPTVVSGTALTNSPYHTESASTYNTWYQVTNTDPAGPYTYGSSSVTLDLGAVSNSKLISLSTSPTGNSALGTLTSTGVYTSPSVGLDGIFHGSHATNNSPTAIGVQLNGLGAGTYDIYVTARNTSSGANYVQNIYAGATAATGNFDFTNYAMESLSYANATVKTAAWIEGNNYVKLSVTLTALNPVLNIAVEGMETGEERAFLNSLQIVSAIPEPSTSAVLAGAGMLLLAGARRRRLP